MHKPQYRPKGLEPCRTSCQLPYLVLLNVLQRVPEQDRRRNARVSTAWAAAAAEVTDSLYLVHQSPARLQADWRQCAPRVGTQLTSLHLECPYYSTTFRLTQLPCAQLRKLSLNHIYVQLGPNSAGGQDDDAGGGVLHTAPTLTRLVLQSVRLLGGGLRRQLSALTALRNLQQLRLADCFEGLEWNTWIVDPEAATWLATSLQPLAQLSHLDVRVARGFPTAELREACSRLIQLSHLSHLSLAGSS